MGDSDNPRYEPPIDSSDDPDEEEDDETRPTGLDDHIPEDETEETEEVDESSGGGSSTGAAAAAGGAAGAAAGAGGAAAGGAAGTPSPTPEEPAGEDPDECGESETPEESEVPEPEPKQEEEQPDEEPDLEEDSDDTEQEEEKEEEEDDEDNDEEDEQKAQIVVHSDAWDSVGWGIYPVRLQLKEEYGDQVQFDDRLVPVREFDSPEEMMQHWLKWAPRHGMPVKTDIWTGNPPESTELSNRAIAAAREQSIPRAKRFMRRLKEAAIVEGTNIEDQEKLLELARNVGLDSDQLKEDLADVRVRTNFQEIETPKITIHVDGETITQSGLVTINDVKTPLKRAGLEADDPQSLYGFVDEYGPVALKEVRQVYGYEEGEALEELQTTDGIESVKYGETTFWVTM